MEQSNLDIASSQKTGLETVAGTYRELHNPYVYLYNSGRFYSISSGQKSKELRTHAIQNFSDNDLPTPTFLSMIK